jgi:hypothetical protein
MPERWGFRTDDRWTVIELNFDPAWCVPSLVLENAGGFRLADQPAQEPGQPTAQNYPAAGLRGRCLKKTERILEIF